MRKNKQQWPADHVERRKVADLIPYARNAREHDDDQVAQIAASIREWGWTIPALIDEDGSVIAGHGRILAARKLKLDEIPVMIASGWTEAQKKAYRIADNQLALNATWNDELLRVELQELNDDGYELDLLGFEFDEINWILKGPEDTEDGADELSENYTRKIEAPIYTPSGDKPKETDLCDRSRTTALREEIDKAELPAEVAEFLRVAAERHTVFRFDKIAEYYAHADATVQNLMERSALVIIDFDKAIENGFVKLSQEVLRQIGRGGSDNTEGTEASEPA